MKTISKLFLMGSAILVISIAALAITLTKEPRATVQIVIGAAPTRDQVNAAAARLLLAGRGSELYDFYAYEVGDPLKAALYVQSAMEGDGTHPAPIDLVMAIGWWEGGHQIDKTDGPNLNGSFDVRPMGLNSMTYHQYTISELERIEVNIPFGVSHLVTEKRKWGVSWEAALASYNKGSPSGLDQRQIDYVVNVLRHEWELDRRFAARFPEMF